MGEGGVIFRPESGCDYPLPVGYVYSWYPCGGEQLIHPAVRLRRIWKSEIVFAPVAIQFLALLRTGYGKNLDRGIIFQVIVKAVDQRQTLPAVGTPGIEKLDKHHLAPKGMGGEGASVVERNGKHG